MESGNEKQGMSSILKPRIHICFLARFPFSSLKMKKTHTKLRSVGVFRFDENAAGKLFGMPVARPQQLRLRFSRRRENSSGRHIRS